MVKQTTSNGGDFLSDEVLATLESQFDQLGEQES
jgi:hypothetical protein